MGHEGCVRIMMLGCYTDEVLDNGSLLILEKAVPANADKIIVPPIKVKLSGISFRNIQTHIGASITSESDKSVSSAAGIVFDPIVYKTKPKPTWKIPIAKAMTASFWERNTEESVEIQIKPVTGIANSPERNTVGSISVDLPRRKAKVKTAKPMADPKAAKLPPKEEEPSLSETITKTPAKAAPIAIHVSRLIFSRRKNLPSKAAKNGAVANNNSAFATEIF